eukprot:Nk52_evm3s1444 gene=Nk52_evmTU3s1444
MASRFSVIGRRAVPVMGRALWGSPISHRAGVIGVSNIAMQSRGIRYGNNPKENNFESIAQRAVEELTKPRSDKEYDVEVEAFLARIDNAVGKDVAKECLTHYTYEGDNRNGDRMKIIGESVMDLYVTEMIMTKFPNLLSLHVESVKNYLLASHKIISYGRKLGLENLVRANKPAEGRFSFIISDCYLSLVGGIALNAAPEVARDFVRNFSEAALEKLDLDEVLKFQYPTLMLRHILAKEGRPAVRVVVLNEIGKNTAYPLFQVALYEGDAYLSQGSGKSLKDAKNAAARKALKEHFTKQYKLAAAPSENLAYQEKVLEFTKQVKAAGLLKERF